MEKDKPKKKAKKVSVHYVNNKEFSLAVVEYVNAAAAAVAEGKEAPIITNYIGTCFMKITEGLSHAPNFIRYSYRDEMVMDANENCVKAIMNYDITKATRTGLPNAFAYFTQISYFAFLRRIQKEKKQYDIKLKYIESASIDAFADFGTNEAGSGDGLISKIRSRTDSINHKDDSFIEDDQFKKLMPKKKAIKRGWQKKAKAVTTAQLEFDDDGQANAAPEIEAPAPRMVKTITRRSQTSA
jgi:hypothetical protein